MEQQFAGKLRWRLAVALAAALSLYALAGFFLAPGIVANRVHDALAAHTGLEAGSARVTVNPFTFSARLENLRIGGPGAPNAQAAVVTVRFSPAQIFRRGWHLRALEVSAPRLALPTGPDLLTRVLASISPGTPLHVARMTVTDGAVSIGTGTREFLLSKVAGSLRDAGSGADHNGAFTLSATVNGSGTVAAEGSFAFAPATVDAAVSVAGVEVGQLRTPVLSGADLFLSAATLSGEVTLHATAERSALEGDLALIDVEVSDAAGSTVVFAAAEVRSEEFSFQSPPSAVSAKLLRVTAPAAALTRVTGGGLGAASWVKLLLRGPARLAERLEFADGRLTLTDLSVSPPLRLDANAIEGSLTQEDPDAAMLELDGRLTPQSRAQVRARWTEPDPTRSSVWSISIRDLDAALLSPYLRAAAGRGIDGGALDAGIEGKVTDGAVALGYTLRTAGLALGEQHEVPGAAGWPLELAIALFEDTDGVIEVAVPVPAARLDDGTTPLTLMRDALRALVTRVTTSPFETLSELEHPPPQDLGMVGFDAGSAALDEAASARLGQLAAVLEQRPGLGLEIAGSYDPAADRAALARQQVRLHIALATSAGPPEQASRAPLNLEDPKVVSVLDEFAGTRLSAPVLAQLRAEHPERGREFYAAVLEALMANETVSEHALKNLGRFRARSIAGALGAAGIAAERLAVANQVRAVTDNAGAVRVELGVRPLLESR